MALHPVNLPDVQDAGPEWGLARTLICFGLYGLAVVGAIAYLLRKLPRQADAGPPPDEPDGRAGE